MSRITTAEIDKAIAKAIEYIRTEADNATEASMVGAYILIEDALAHLHESVPGMQTLAARYNSPGIIEPIEAFLALTQGHTDSIDLGDEEDEDEPEPRRLNPAEQRKRDGESCLNAEDVAELRTPLEEPGSDWKGNEDI